MKTHAPNVAARLAAVLFAFAAFPPAGAQTIGTIVYLAGTVEIVRDEDTLNPKIVKEGLALENFDLLVTGADGEAELQITSPMAPTTTVRVAPRTRFSLEIGRTGSKSQTTVGLMIGSVTLKCAKLTGSQSVKVQTDTALMGVRGTTFTVTAATSGDILVACDEGEVECTDEKGNTEQADPGEVVERLVEQGLRRHPVDATSLEQFRRNWTTERIAALKANAGTVIPLLAGRYMALRTQFYRDFATLEKARKIIDKWKAEDREGKIGGAPEVAKEKKEVIGALFRLRRTLFTFERVYLRLLDMKQYHDEGFGRGTIRSGLASESTTTFFRRLESDRRDLERKMARVRFVARLYANRNDGMTPRGGLGDEEDENLFLAE